MDSAYQKGIGMSELAEILRGMADMADMLDGPQNAGNLVVPSIIRRFREAADAIERLKIENDALHEDNSNLRAEICVFCKENSRLEGMITGCTRCRYNPKGVDS